MSDTLVLLNKVVNNITSLRATCSNRIYVSEALIEYMQEGCLTFSLARVCLPRVSDILLEKTALIRIVRCIVNNIKG